MKHLRMYESYSIESIKKLSDDYDNFLQGIKPYIIKKYNQLANDKNYHPEYGSKPYKVSEDDLSIASFTRYNNKFEFNLFLWNYGDVENSFYVILSEQEMEEILTKINVEKYNL